MPKIVFDVETVGQDFEGLDKLSKEYFLKYADTDEKIEEVKNSLSFYPLTAQIVAIAMVEVESGQGAVYFQNGNKGPEKSSQGPVTFIAATEKEILTHFWNQLQRYDQFITFNGRVFDCPFIMLRSAIHQLRPTKNLVPYRYNFNSHIDLADQLTFYDALRRRFTLHMWCQAFGVKSPKMDGISGLQVKELFKQERYLDIARYCLEDVQATKEIFFYWDKYLKFSS